MIPDKAQHYWGSYLLNEILTKHLGSVKGSLITFSLGFLWEVNDNQTQLTLDPEDGVVGFSYRDLIADGFGAVSSLINKSEKYKVMLDYSDREKWIMLKGYLIF